MESKNIYLREMQVSYGRKRVSVPANWERRIASSSDARPLFSAYADHPQEHFLALALDAKNRPVAFQEVFKGSLASCHVSAAELFRFAILATASRLIIGHNHPSGDPSPSPQDAELTGKLCTLGKDLGIEILDHLIVARDGYFSFLDQGLMSQPLRPTHA